MFTKTLLSLLYILVSASLVCFATSIPNSLDQLNGKDLQVEYRASPLSRVQGKYVVPAPSGSARFVFFRPGLDRQLANSLGYKRSTSVLDTLTGGVMGKRSMNAPVELVNMEPILGRQYNLRSSPRMYDLHWSPVEANFDGPTIGQESD